MNREILEQLSDFALENSNFEDLENVIGQKYGAGAARQFRDISNRKKMSLTKPFAGSTTKGFSKNAAASFTINIVRLSTNISASLPVPIFGANDAPSGWADVIAPSLPSGVFVDTIQYGALNTGSAGTSARKLILNFEDSVGGKDGIEVTCTQNNYPSLLNATLVDIMTLGGIRYGISNSANVAQFDEEIKVVKRSLTGRQTNDSLTPSQYKSPEQFQSGIIDITEGFSIDKQTTIVLGFGQFAMTVSLNCYAATLQKYDAATELGR
jgi:hypothetical protein